MTSCNVSNHFRNKERTETRTNCVFSLCVVQYFFFESMKSSDTYSENNSDSVQVFCFNVDSGISYSFFGSYDGILSVQVHLTCLFAVDKIGRLEVLHFTSKLSLEFRSVEMSNRSRPTDSVDKVVPKFRNSITYRSECTKTCYHYSL